MKLDMGVILHTGDMSYKDIIRYAQEAEALGYHGLWLTEESGKEAFSLFGVLARETKRINLCSGIVNFYSRSPTTLAMAARSIHDLSGGRCSAGLGAKRDEFRSVLEHLVGGQRRDDRLRIARRRIGRQRADGRRAVARFGHEEDQRLGADRPQLFEDLEPIVEIGEDDRVFEDRAVAS